MGTLAELARRGALIHATLGRHLAHRFEQIGRAVIFIARRGVLGGFVAAAQNGLLRSRGLCASDRPSGDKE
jgi:hypothetical protein